MTFLVNNAVRYRCVRLEDIGAVDQRASDYCTQLASACHLVEGIIGHLHGSMSPGEHPPYTELVYHAAVRAEIPRLLFVAPDGFSVPANLIEPDAQRRSQEGFCRTVLLERICDRNFSIPDDLRRRLIQSLRKGEAEVAANQTQSGATSNRRNSPAWRPPG